MVLTALFIVPQYANAGVGTIASTAQGSTPFIAYVESTYAGGSIKQVGFYIHPKPGSNTRPFVGFYTASYLSSLGFINGNVVVNSVFGLYPGMANNVDIYYIFTDGSVNVQQTTITTPAYTDTCPAINTPKMTQSRTSTNDLSFDYFLLKDYCSNNAPVIIDTDGNLRWVGTTSSGSPAIALYKNAIFFSDGKTGINRMDLSTGVATKLADYASYNVTNSGHHNIDPGRDGLVLDVNTTTETEAVNLEIDSTTGQLLNSWDLGQIISSAMTAGGDSPANFVRPVGTDWFHNNATTYNPKDNTLIVSSRENFVIAVDYDTPADGQKKIHWILGDTTKAWYQYPSLRKYALKLSAGTLPPIGQHAVSINHNGNLLLFDDGNGSIYQNPAGLTRNFSAVREYQINVLAMTATSGYVYTPNPVIYSAICGSVYDVNGNYLVDFATANSGNTLDLQGLGGPYASKLVFDLQYPQTAGCSTGWNAVPLQSSAFLF